MTDREAMKLALEALEQVTKELLAVRDELAERGARPTTNVFHQRLWDSSFDAYTNHAMPAAQALRTAIAEAEKQKPVAWTERELKLIDGMIEVQLDHARRCDNIANRTMANKQKGWDMERVALLQKIRDTPPAAQQEPVAWADMDVRGEDKGLSWTPGHFHTQPLYTTPPAAQQKPLTDEEIDAVCAPLGFAQLSPREVARAIEAAHGITGERT